MSSDNNHPLYTRRRVIGLGAAAVGATVAGRAIPSFGAQGSAIDSYNWSGARVTSDVLPLLFPQATNPQFFKSVKATWKVPNVGIHKGANGQEVDSQGASDSFRSAAWIGLDGGTWGLTEYPNPYVLLAGIYHKWGTSAEYTPFFGWDTGKSGDDIYLNPPFVNPIFTISAKDTITVELVYDRGTSPPSATATFAILGSTNQPPPVTITFNAPPIPIGYTVQWIFERISKDNKQNPPWSYHGLGNHDAVVFRDAVATTDQGYAVSPDQGDSIHMRKIEDWPDLLTEGTAHFNQVEITRRKDSA
jgi:hypothetical protein